MKTDEFYRLSEVTEEELLEDKLNEGDKFLYGESMIKQKYEKSPGDTISYYKVISKMGKNIAYMEQIERIE